MGRRQDPLTATHAVVVLLAAVALATVVVAAAAAPAGSASSSGAPASPPQTGYAAAAAADAAAQPATDAQLRRAHNNLRTLLRHIAPASSSTGSSSSGTSTLARGTIPVTARSLKRYVQSAPRVYHTVVLVSTRNTHVDCLACSVLRNEMGYAAAAFHTQVHQAAMALGLDASSSSSAAHDADTDDDDDGGGAVASTPPLPLRGAHSGVFFVELDVWDERTAFRELGLQSLPYVFVVSPSLPSNADVDTNARAGADVAADADADGAATTVQQGVPPTAFTIPLAGFAAHANVTAYPLGRPPTPDTPLPAAHPLRAEQIVRFVATRTGRTPTVSRRRAVEADARTPTQTKKATTTAPVVTVATAGAGNRTAADARKAAARARRHAQRRKWRRGDPVDLAADVAQLDASADELAVVHVPYGGNSVFERTQFGAPSLEAEQAVWQRQRDATVRTQRLTNAALGVALLVLVAYLVYRVVLAASRFVLLFLVSCVLFFCYSGGWYTLLRSVPFIGMSREGGPVVFSPQAHGQYGLEGFVTGLVNGVCAVLLAAVVACGRAPPRRDLRRARRPATRTEEDDMSSGGGGNSVVVGACFATMFLLFLVLRMIYSWKMPAYLRVYQ